MQAKSERFEMRLEPATLDRVDAYRSSQPDRPTRAEAVRRLVDIGLASQGGPTLALHGADKLILAMLSGIAKKVQATDEIDPQFVEDALYSGHYWGLEWQHDHLLGVEETPKEVVEQVVDILDVWSFLLHSYAQLSDTDKARVRSEVWSAAEDEPELTFPGFDGNNEGSHLSAARFMVDKLDRFQSLKGQIRNSHYPTVSGYMAMARAFEPIRPTLIGKGLDANQIIKLMKIRRGP